MHNSGESRREIAESRLNLVWLPKKDANNEWRGLGLPVALLKEPAMPGSAPAHRSVSIGNLQIARDAFTSGASSLEPGRICMTVSMYSQIAPSRPNLSRDAFLAP
jgi:hypothetical protein